MDKKSSTKRAGILFGGGGLGVILAMACCLPLIFTGLIAVLGLNFFIPDNLLVVVITVAIAVLFVAWRLKMRKVWK